jgi:(1->4)-alpha-D-glucan 1-alpha-D-glucosylmutase
LLRATARLQFHRGFPLDAARAIVPYLHRLGISHLYASPLLMSRPGSTHGYDIVDHNRIDPELGGTAALQRLVETLRAHGMGLILDIVPNHMGVGGEDNTWWLDVLEWGRASPYAGFFDIDWDPPDSSLRGRLLAPFLGASYGDALAAGDIRLRFDATDGRFVVYAHGAHRFPVAPRDYADILQAGGVGDLPRLPSEMGRSRLRQAAEEMRGGLLAVYGGRRDGFERALDAFAPETEAGRLRLHRLLERQHYRLAWWRAAADEINWRRFFDINGLAGVRVEVPAVFDATHARVLQLYADGLIDGVRIDHVDGLADPRGYCRKLRRRLMAMHARRPEALRGAPPVIWVEKILSAHERLAGDWLTDGTTGYDFMNDVSAVLHDPEGEARLTALWTTMTGRPADFGEEARPARRQILRDALASELNATAAALHRILRRNLATRDWTITAARHSLEELLVHFPSYRIYTRLGGASATDARDMAWAMAGAQRTTRRANRPLLDVAGGILLGEGMRAARPGERAERLRAQVRFQQLSAPTAAKSVEDTAFYRYGRLLSRNEVGSEPGQFALAPIGFHATARARRQRLPRALLATATHDHKRGEDTRARLAVLSEVAGAWETAVARWTRLNAPQKRAVEGAPAPDAADELMLYQTLVAAWPLDLSPDDAAGMDEFRDRVAAWQEKAVREAKRHSEWAAPNEAYEAACRDFLAACLDPARPAGVAGEIGAFAARIAVPGAANALAQTLLRLTTPGVPDLYQGSEFWDFSLVDPDNRRPVDYAARAAALAAGGAPADLLAHWRDGRVKQAVVARALALRTRLPLLFGAGDYRPLRVEGPLAPHVLAFMRSHGGAAAIVAVLRLPAPLIRFDDPFSALPLPDRSVWSEGEAATMIVLPRSIVGRPLADVFGGAILANLERTGSAGRLAAADLFAALPVALLEVT